MDFMIASVQKVETGLGIERGEDMVRANIASDPAIQLSAAEIKQGLRDSCYVVRMSMALRDEYTPTEQEVSVGLEDDSVDVRLAFLMRHDINLTTGQVQNALNSPYIEEFMAVLGRSDFELISFDCQPVLTRAESLEDGGEMHQKIKSRIEDERAVQMAVKRMSAIDENTGVPSRKSRRDSTSI